MSQIPAILTSSLAAGNMNQQYSGGINDEIYGAPNSESAVALIPTTPDDSIFSQTHGDQFDDHTASTASMLHSRSEGRVISTLRYFYHRWLKKILRILIIIAINIYFAVVNGMGGHRVHGPATPSEASTAMMTPSNSILSEAEDTNLKFAIISKVNGHQINDPATVRSLGSTTQARAGSHECHILTRAKRTDAGYATISAVHGNQYGLPPARVIQH